MKTENEKKPKQANYDQQRTSLILCSRMNEEGGWNNYRMHYTCFILTLQSVGKGTASRVSKQR